MVNLIGITIIRWTGMNSATVGVGYINNEDDYI